MAYEPVDCTHGRTRLCSLYKSKEHISLAGRRKPKTRQMAEGTRENGIVNKISMIAGYDKYSENMYMAKNQTPLPSPCVLDA